MLRFGITDKDVAETQGVWIDSTYKGLEIGSNLNPFRTHGGTGSLQPIYIQIYIHHLHIYYINVQDVKRNMNVMKIKLKNLLERK